MPISGGNSSSLSEELIQQLESLNLSGGLGFRFTAEGKVFLSPNTKTLILPALAEETNRQIFVSHPHPTAKVFLLWADNETELLTLYPGGTWIDSNDGGIALRAICDREVELTILIRQTTEITYQIGSQEMPEPNLLMRGISPGLAGWGFPLAIFNLMNFEAETNFRLIFDPETAATGHKMWSFDAYSPGKEYEFTISPGNSGAGASKPILIYLLRVEVLAAARQAFQSVEIFDNLAAIPRELIDFIKKESWIADVPADGGTFRASPASSRFVLFFGAENPDSGFIDVCFTEYTGNSADPKQGGAFTITGF